MRNTLIWAPLLLAAFVEADTANVIRSPFLDASSLSDDLILDSNGTIPAGELLKRQSGCASGYSNCFGVGAPGLCCRPSSVCSADSSGNVGCCPLGAACTGRLAGATPVSTITGAATTTRNTGSFIASAATTTAPVGTASRSTVTNPYYPFPYIATTYVNAAACSAAWTGCQTDLASCSVALTGGGYGVTISAPNGGITVQPVTTTLAPAAASSVCSSLSAQACYGLQVEACASFGNGAAETGAAGRFGPCIYGMGAGVAVGMAGQILG